jgi:hypothetical protein
MILPTLLATNVFRLSGPDKPVQPQDNPACARGLIGFQPHGSAVNLGEDGYQKEVNNNKPPRPRAYNTSRAVATHR